MTDICAGYTTCQQCFAGDSVVTVLDPVTSQPAAKNILEARKLTHNMYPAALLLTNNAGLIVPPPSLGMKLQLHLATKPAATWLTLLSQASF